MKPAMKNEIDLSEQDCSYPSARSLESFFGIWKIDKLQNILSW